MSIKFTIPNVPTQVDYTATLPTNNGATIPIINKPTIPTALSQLTNDSLNVTGTVILPAPVAATWYCTTNVAVAANVSVTPAPWVLKSWSKVPTNVTLLNSSNQLVIPYNGVYTVCFGVRWQSATPENSSWLQSQSGTYGNDNGGTFRFCTCDMTTGGIYTNGSYTGYFASGDVLQPQVFCGSTNTLVNQYGGNYMSMTLITRTA